jgi:hypothetical protein
MVQKKTARGGEAWIKLVLRTKLSLFVTNHHVMLTCGGVEVGTTYSKSDY